MAPAPRDLAFISYSHEDKTWRDRLLIFLKPYVRKGYLSVWADPHIRVGNKWRREIAEALTRTRIAVLLVSPNFLASDFIDEEELPPLLKAVEDEEVTLVAIPVSTVDPGITPFADRQWARSPATPLDLLDEAQRNAALVKIVRSIAELAAAAGLHSDKAEPTASTSRRPAEAVTISDRLGELRGVPEQRPNFVARQEDLDRLKSELFATSQQAVGLTGTSKVGLHGMGGIGKTVMAIALARDEEVRRAFPGGVLWLTLGQQPEVLRLQGELAALLSLKETSFASITLGREALRTALAEKACLLILDDLWRAMDVEPFDVLGPRARLLTTTRDASLLTAIGAGEVNLSVLSEPAALTLLARWSGQVEPLPAVAVEVSTECGFLPLALSLAGARVHDGATWDDVLAALKTGDLEFLDHPYGSVFKSLRMSVEALPAEAAARLRELAVFPEDTEVPVTVACRLWRHSGGCEDYHSRDLLRRLERKGLLYLSGEGENLSLSFHDLQKDFLRLIADDMPTLHRQLLDAYREDVTTWSRLPRDEPYLWTHLAYHLAEAGLADELRGLLLNYTSERKG